MNNKYKSQSKALPTMGIDSLVIKEALIKQAKFAKHTSKGIKPKELKSYSFTLKGFFNA